HIQIPDAYKEALSCEHVRPVGLHCHIGSQILDTEPFARAASVMMGIARILSDMGVKLSFIDLGGGLGIPYRHDSDPSPTFDDYADAVVPVFTEGLEQLSTKPELWVEPGRSIVGDSTVLLSRVNSVKRAHKRFVNIDAGFNLLVRPVMYDAYHEVIVAGKADAPGQETYTVTGPICESGDIIAADRMLPGVGAGDLVAILDAGAYGFAMSSQYNSRPRCAEVVVKGGRSAVMRRAETLGDIVAPMQCPPWQR
ncbi:MAG: diaminopimelate decarboxylase, partial [Methanoregulaceae archaeon]|nr:diaminopimelate decarboxylase [Methanoregulaceae archaeon]